MNLNSLDNMPRLLLEADLRPVAGNRFQPTGFADLGAAENKLPDNGPSMLLVESAQSVANRLEKTCLDGDGPLLDPALSGLPYVVVELKASRKRRALVESNRIASPYILLNKEFNATLVKELAYNPEQHLDWRSLRTMYRYAPTASCMGAFSPCSRAAGYRAARHHRVY